MLPEGGMVDGVSAAGRLDYDIVGIAASLGGLRALASILAALPVDFPLPILIVQHIPAAHPSRLPEVLARRTALRVEQAVEGARPTAGSVHVAPPGRHLLVRTDGRLGLSDSGLLNFCRPSADVLFRSLSTVCGARAVAVMLTGLGRDGARGMGAVAAAGGMTIAQDEATSEAPDMPRAAVEIGHAELVLPLDRIAFALEVLASGVEVDEREGGSDQGMLTK